MECCCNLGPKQVAFGSTVEGVAPARPAMLGCVVEHMAALAKRGEIPRSVTTRIVSEMAAGQHHTRDRQPRDPT